MNKYLKIYGLRYTKQIIFIAICNIQTQNSLQGILYSEKVTVYVSALCGKREMFCLMLKDLVRRVKPPTPWSFQDVQENIMC